MSFSALGLCFAFASSLCWGALDALRKTLVAKMDMVSIVVVLSLGQAPIFIAWALLSDIRIDLESYWPYGMLSIAVNIAANLLFMLAVRVSALSLTIPFLSFAPVFAALIAIPALGEIPTLIVWTGIALVVLGALLLTRRENESLLRSLLRERGSLYMIVVASLWATSTSVDKVALQHASIPLHALVSTLGVGFLLLGFQFSQKRQKAWNLKGGGVLLFALVLAAGAAYGLQLLALESVWVGVVEALKRAVGMVLSVVVGYWLFREPLTLQKWVSVGIMITGTVLVIWG